MVRLKNVKRHCQQPINSNKVIQFLIIKSMCPANFIPILLILIAMLVIYQTVRRLSTLKRFNIQANLLGTSKTVQNNLDGQTYETHYSPGRKNSPPSFTVRVPCLFRGSFEISKEKVPDQFFKSVGLCVEIQSGDMEFDRDYYVNTDEVDFTTQFLTDPANREVIRSLFRIGFTTIAYNGKTMEAVWKPFRPDDYTKTDFVPDAVRHLAVLVNNLPAAVGRTATWQTKPWGTIRGLAYSIPGFLFALGIILTISSSQHPPLDGGRLFMASLKHSVPLLVGFILVCFFSLKGRSSSHRELGIVLIISLIGFPLAGNGVMSFANSHYDQGLPSMHRVQILNKWTTRHKSSTSYHIAVQSWRGSEPESLKIFSSEYRQITPGRTRIEIVTKPGRFGFEWLVSHRIVS